MDTLATPNTPTTPLRVLLVDDHEDTNRSLLLLLRRRGYEVKTATSIAAAIEVAGTQDFDVLVSDMGLPDGSGLDLLAQMPTPPSLGGIVVSGYGMDEDIERSKAAGYREHLSKPVNVDKLDSVIRRLAALPRSGS
jgi:CheY-like chemotaxis protein